jgi:pilus assembly protein Flp/PilA
MEEGIEPLFFPKVLGIGPFSHSHAPLLSALPAVLGTPCAIRGGTQEDVLTLIRQCTGQDRFLLGRAAATDLIFPTTDPKETAMKKILDAVTLAKIRAGIAARKLLSRKEEGATLAEYGLLLALIAVVCIAAITVLGTKISSMFTSIAGSI